MSRLGARLRHVSAGSFEHLAEANVSGHSEVTSAPQHSGTGDSTALLTASHLCLGPGRVDSHFSSLALERDKLADTPPGLACLWPACKDEPTDVRRFLHPAVYTSVPGAGCREEVPISSRLRFRSADVEGCSPPVSTSPLTWKSAHPLCPLHR